MNDTDSVIAEVVDLTKEQANIFSYIFTGMSLKDFTIKMLDDIKQSDISNKPYCELEKDNQSNERSNI